MSGVGMQSYLYVAIVTLLAALVYFWMATQVARTRRRTGILPPVMTGDPQRRAVDKLCSEEHG